MKNKQSILRIEIIHRIEELKLFKNIKYTVLIYKVKRVIVYLLQVETVQTSMNRLAVYHSCEHVVGCKIKLAMV